MMEFSCRYAPGERGSKGRWLVADGLVGERLCGGGHRLVAMMEQKALVPTSPSPPATFSQWSRA